MKKCIVFLCLFLSSFLSLSAQSASELFVTEMPELPSYNFSEMDVTELLSILNNDLDWWNETSQIQEAALKKALELLKTEYEARQQDLQSMNGIKQLLQQSEVQLQDSKKSKADLERKHNVLRVVSASTTVALGISLGGLVGGFSGATYLGLAAAIVAALQIAFF